MVYDEVYQNWTNFENFHILNYSEAGTVCVLKISWKPGTSPDFSDLRVVDAFGSELPHFIYSHTRFGEAEVHVRLGFSRDFTVYSGNAAAENKSSGPAVYDYFLDLNGLLDLTGIMATYTLDYNENTIHETDVTTSYHFIIDDMSVLGDKYVLEADVKIETGTSTNKRIGLLFDCASNVATGNLFMHNTSYYGFATASNNSVSFTSQTRDFASSFAYNNWLRMAVYRDRSTGSIIGQTRYNGYGARTVLTSTTYTTGYAGIMGYGSEKPSVKNLRVRKHPTGSKKIKVYAYEDTYIDANNPDTNYGSATSLITDVDRYTFYKFNLMDLIASGLNIQGATAVLKVPVLAGTVINGTGNSMFKSTTVQDWDTSTFVYNTMDVDFYPTTPSLGDVYTDLPSLESGFLEIDVTDIMHISPEAKPVSVCLTTGVFQTGDIIYLGSVEGGSPAFLEITLLEPYAVSTSSGMQNPFPYSAFFETTNDVLISVGPVEYIFNRTVESNRTDLIKSSAVKTRFSRSTHKEKTTNMFVRTPRTLSHIYPMQHVSALISVDPVKTKFDRLSGGRNLTSYMSVPQLGFDNSRVLESHRTTQDYVESVDLLNNLGIGLHLTSLIGVDTPGLELSFLREFVRTCQMTVGDVGSECLVSNDKRRTVLISTAAFIDTSRSTELTLTSGLDVGQVTELADRVADLMRSAELKSNPVRFRLVTGIWIERRSEMSVNPVSVSVNRVLASDRSADCFVDVSEIVASSEVSRIRSTSITVGEAKVLLNRIRRLTVIYDPVTAEIEFDNFTVDIGFDNLTAEIDFNSYTADLSLKYLNESAGGRNVYEITQYDEETVTAYLKDTDPDTGLPRLISLDGKSVKATIKGGFPTTTIAKDCTIVGDGTVSFDLTSEDTGVPGNYIITFVITGTDYRKEIPNRLDDVIEVRINDSNYAG